MNKPRLPSDVLTHLGIDRHAGSSTSDDFIEARISLARRTAYSLMGTGFHGVNGVSPQYSIPVYMTYVLPRMLYGLDAITLKEKHVKSLEQFHRNIPETAADTPHENCYLCHIPTLWCSNTGMPLGYPDSFTPCTCRTSAVKSSSTDRFLSVVCEEHQIQLLVRLCSKTTLPIWTRCSQPIRRQHQKLCYKAHHTAVLAILAEGGCTFKVNLTLSRCHQM